MELKHNKHKKEQHLTSGFAKLGGGVTTQAAAGTKTAGDNPNCVQLSPQLRKAASPLYENQRKRSWQKPSD